MTFIECCLASTGRCRDGADRPTQDVGGRTDFGVSFVGGGRANGWGVDHLIQTLEYGAMGLGTIITTAVFLAAIIAIVGYMTLTSKSETISTDPVT